MKLFTNVGIGWLGRLVGRAGSIGFGTIGSLFALYNSVPPNLKPVVDNLLSHHWDTVTLTGLIGLGGYVLFEVLGYKSTVKPQIVTNDGTKAPLNEVTPTARESIEIVAKTAVEDKPRGPIISILKGVFGK